MVLICPRTMEAIWQQLDAMQSGNQVEMAVSPEELDTFFRVIHITR